MILRIFFVMMQPDSQALHLHLGDAAKTGGHPPETAGAPGGPGRRWFRGRPYRVAASSMNR
jgi:hypothetical protein